MNKNVGGTDRHLRILGAIVLLGSALKARGIERVAALLAGAILLFTAAVQRCPLNALAGVDTCRRRERSEPDW